MAATRREFLKGAGATIAAGGVLVRSRSTRAQARPGVPAVPIKIGVLASRAGVTAPVGQAGLRGTEWWAERVNRSGGILGRRVQLVVEEETNPKDTVERYRKLVLQEKVDVVVGVISTGVSLALGSVVEEMDTPWLAWDGTTQKGVAETIPSPSGRSGHGQRGRGDRGRHSHRQVLQGGQDDRRHQQRLLLRA
jgi:branched-chain amino acid transport system substrate-binding protein